MSFPWKRLRAASTMTHRPHTSSICLTDDSVVHFWVKGGAGGGRGWGGQLVAGAGCILWCGIVEDKGAHWEECALLIGRQTITCFTLLVKLTVRVLVAFHLPNLPQINLHLSVALSKCTGYIRATSGPQTAFESLPPRPIKASAHRVESL